MGKNTPPAWRTDNVAEASKNTRNIYFLYIGFISFCALTLIGITDRQIILNEGAQLPIFNLDVSLKGFFVISPIVATLIYVFFQIYLIQLKSSLHELHDHYEVERWQIYPWLINFKEQNSVEYLGAIQNFIINITVWWLLPLFLMLFSYWCIKTHNLVLTSIIGLYPSIGLVVVLFFWNLGDKISYKNTPQKEGKWFARFFKNHTNRFCMVMAILTYTAIYFVILIPFSLEGGRGLLQDLTCLDLSYGTLMTNGGKSSTYDHVINLNAAHLEGAKLSHANLKGADLSQALCIRAIANNVNFEGADLQNSDMRYANFEGANFKKTKLSGVNFEGANLLHTKNLNEIQLAGVKSLYQAKLPPRLLSTIEKNRPYLLLKELRGVDLRGANLTRANLKKRDVKGSNLQGASLEDANCENANLSKADLTAANLRSAILYKTQMRETVLKRADLSWADLTGAELTGADLEGADLKYANFHNANLKDANLKGVSFSNVDIAYTDLSSAKNLDISQIFDAKGVHLAKLSKEQTKAIMKTRPTLLLKSLMGANLAGANLKDTNFEGQNLQEINCEKANMEGADLSSARLYKANLKSANLHKADLRNANLERADLQKADLTSAKMYNANLTAAKISNADFGSADLSNARLINSDLQHTIFRGAKLRSAKFNGAILLDADFENAVLQYAVFTGANCEGSQFKGANLTNTDLRGVKNVTIDQLSKAKTLTSIKIETDTRRKLEAEYPLLILKTLDGFDFSGQDLSQHYLPDREFIKGRFEKTNLSKTILEGSKLTHAILNRANLAHADLGRCDLSLASMVEADLQGAKLHMATLNGANLNGANLQNTNLANTEIKKAQLHKVDLKNSNLYGADLRSSDLREANFANADIEKANLAETDLRGAVNLTIQQLNAAKSLYKTNLDEHWHEQIKALPEDKFKPPTE